MVTERDLEELSKAMDDLKDRVTQKVDVQQIHRAIDNLRIKLTDFEQKLKPAEPSPPAPSPHAPSALRSRAAPRPSSA